MKTSAVIKLLDYYAGYALSLKGTAINACVDSSKLMVELKDYYRELAEIGAISFAISELAGKLEDKLESLQAELSEPGNPEADRLLGL